VLDGLVISFLRVYLFIKILGIVMAKPMFESDPWNQKESSSSQIKYEDEDNSGSVFHSDFNPDDLERSTSAPPVLELASESLFAFNTDGFEPAGN
jgi:hypothetical protein